MHFPVDAFEFSRRVWQILACSRWIIYTDTMCFCISTEASILATKPYSKLRLSPAYSFTQAILHGHKDLISYLFWPHSFTSFVLTLSSTHNRKRKWAALLLTINFLYMDLHFFQFRSVLVVL